MDSQEIEQEGRDDRRLGRAASECPYSFDKSAYWQAKDYAGFDTVRWKLEAWMRGWIAENKLVAPSRKSKQ